MSSFTVVKAFFEKSYFPFSVILKGFHPRILPFSKKEHAMMPSKFFFMFIALDKTNC